MRYDSHVLRTSRARLVGVLLLVAASTPLALAAETGLRRLMFPPEFDEVRLWLRPQITPWLWLAPITCALAIPLGLFVQRYLVARSLRTATGTLTTAMRASIEVDALLLATSVPQVPAILATMGFTLGAAIDPIAAAIAIATLGIMVIGFVGLRRIGRLE